MKDRLQQLVTEGFAVLPGPRISGGVERLQAAYDAAVVMADAADIRVSSSTRVTDFVNRSVEFDGHYVYPPILAACSLVIGRPFKLSNTCARTLHPGAAAQALHADVKQGGEGWPIVGYIWMVDAFTAENGATRFVPASHLQNYAPHEPGEVAVNPNETIFACGPAGSLIVFNGSVWHGHGANRSAHPRRSVQGHFIARDVDSAIDYGARMRPGTLTRIGNLARYLLDLPSTGTACPP